jgi:hypothetical protein
LHKTSESTERHKTLGQLHNELRNKEPEKCSHLDLGYAFSDDVYKGVLECIQRHYNTFNEKAPAFCVMCVLCPGEGNLSYMVRRKFCAFPWLPSPMPNQSVWLFDRRDDSIKFLWALPTPLKMAKLSEEYSYQAEEERMKKWCDWFYLGTQKFWENIRKMHGIEMFSESEINLRNREMGGKYLDDLKLGLEPNASYLPEVRIKKLEAIGNVMSKQSFNQRLREAN